MKSSGRLLAIFGLAVGLLVLVTVVLVLVFSGNGSMTLLSRDTPEGTVQRYLLAIGDGDYLEAYGYLAPVVSYKPSYEEWKRPFTVTSELPAYRVTLGKINARTDDATVEVIVDIFRPGSPFENPVRTNRITFFLTKDAENWKITSPLDIWWLMY